MKTIKIPNLLGKLTLLCLALMLSACADVPIYKCVLAKPEMGWKPDPMEGALGNHTYFAKEASSGGSEAAGGGCGCN